MVDGPTPSPFPRSLVPMNFLLVLMVLLVIVLTVHDAARWLRPLRLWDADRDRSGRDIRHALT